MTPHNQDREAAAMADARRMAAGAGVRTVQLPHNPTERQALFLDLECKEAFYGGAAGGGKSDALLMAMLKYRDVPRHSALILRRTFKELNKTDAIMDRAHQWLRNTAARWSAEHRRYTFPSTATLEFGHYEHDNDKYQYQSAQYQAIAFDELTEFQEQQYTFLFSRLRRLEGVDVPTMVRAASNPGGVGHDWVKARFIPDDWSPEMALQMQVYWKEGADEDGRYWRRPFVPARIQDNPFLDQADYIESLAELDTVTRAQLLSGDWTIRPRGDILTMWDEEQHVIGFETHMKPLLGRPGIPLNWLLSVYEDQGQTEDHPTVTTWIAKAAAHAPPQILPGSLFIYRGRTQFGMTVKESANDIKMRMAADREIERVRAWKHSHEAKTERIEYQRENGLPFQSWIPGKTRGVAQLRRYHEIVKTRKTNGGRLVPVYHPFKPGVLGSPRIFYCVADEQLAYARDDDGLARHRAEAAAYRWKVNADGSTPAVAVPHDLFNDACVDGNTLIATHVGDVRIRDVTRHHLIRTRNGWRPTATGAHQTGNTRVMRIRTSDGRSLWATANHPVYIHGRGFVRCDAVRIGDRIEPCQTDLSLASMPKLSASMASTSIVTPNHRGLQHRTISRQSTETASEEPSPCTSRFGGPLTGETPSRQDGTSTIKTLIRSIIDWTTSNVFHRKSTHSDTRDDQCQSGELYTSPAFSERLPRGTAAIKAGNGIARTPSDHGVDEPKQQPFAPYQSVASHLRDGIEPNSRARPVVSSVSELTSFAVPVYNLTVEGDHEYYANGILTHNCDTMRMACADYGPPAALPTQEEIFEARLAEEVKVPQPQDADQAALSRVIWADEFAKEQTAQKPPQIPGRAIVSVPRGARIRWR